ncbi:hypothetical protein C8J56DRAFT_1099664 [Mycena floridula]|nr:hypothetical protein C8J56DRAFT_1099664 [Mycena floridula]
MVSRELASLIFLLQIGRAISHLKGTNKDPWLGIHVTVAPDRFDGPPKELSSSHVNEKSSFPLILDHPTATVRLKGIPRFVPTGQLLSFFKSAPIHSIRHYASHGLAYVQFFERQAAATVMQQGESLFPVPWRDSLKVALTSDPIPISRHLETARELGMSRTIFVGSIPEDEFDLGTGVWLRDMREEIGPAKKDLYFVKAFRPTENVAGSALLNFTTCRSALHAMQTLIDNPEFNDRYALRFTPDDSRYGVEDPEVALTSTRWPTIPADGPPPNVYHYDDDLIYPEYIPYNI